MRADNDSDDRDKQVCEILDFAQAKCDFNMCSSCESFKSYTTEEKYVKSHYIKNQNKLRGLSLRANYTDRATAACRRS
jgi:hypothetical protein